MRNRLVVAVAVAVSAGCGSSGQTPADGGPSDTAANDQMVVPEIHPGSDAGDAGDTAGAKDAADGPAACTGPKCPVVLATDTDPGCCVVVDGTYVYWVSYAGSGYSVMRVAGAGGTAASFARSDSIIVRMAIRDGFLYWTASNGVFRRDLTAAGGSATKIASASSTNDPIAVDGSSVYWGGSSPNPIRKVPLAGGTAVDLVPGTDAQYLASDGTNIYWSDFSMQNGSFVMAPVGGGTPTVIASALSNPGDIAVDDSNVYFANSSTLFGTKFWKVPHGGGTPTMIALTTDFAVYEIAVDATSVYWAASNKIGRAPLAGGSVETIATAAGALSIAVDANNVYWLNTDGNPGALMKLAK